jgi:hypothetical protein
MYDLANYPAATGRGIQMLSDESRKALIADSVDNDVFVVYPSPRGNFYWKMRIINGGPLKIHNFLAPATNQMVMLFVRDLKSGKAFNRIDLFNKSMFHESSQSPVNSV